jgi:predicted transcriptional regulator
VIAKPNWYSTPAAKRKRRGVQVMLSDDARKKLRELAAEHPDRTSSAVVEDAIFDAWERTH